MAIGATELKHFTHDGHAITIQTMPDGSGGLLVEAVERGDRIGEAVHVGGAAKDAPGAVENSEAEANAAAADLEARIRSGAIPLRPR